MTDGGDDNINDRLPSAMPSAEEGVDTADLHTFLSQFSGGSHQFILFRTQPTKAMIGGKVRSVFGHLETFSEAPTLDLIRDAFGGGKFEIRVMGAMPGQKGHRILTSRKFDIAGDPKLKPDSLVDDAPTAGAETEVLRTVIDNLQEEKRRTEEMLAREREQRHEGRASADRIEARLTAMEEATKAKESSLARELERRDREITQLRHQLEQRASSTTESDLLKLSFARGSEDTGRLMEAHRAELQAERERNQRELTAANERAARELDVARRDREQAVQLLERMHQAEMEMLRTAQAQLLATKDAEIGRINDSLREVRAIKDRDIVEELERLTRIKEAASNIVGDDGDGDGDGDGKFDWRQLMQQAVKEAGPLLQKFAATPTVVEVPYYVPRGMPGAMRPRMPQPPAAQAMRPRAPTAVAATAMPPTVAAPPPTPAIATDEGSVQTGLEFVETAYRNRHPAPTVAQAIVSAFPKEMVKQLVSAGASRLADAIVTANPDSLLASPGGRTFIGEVLDALGSHLTK